MAGNHKINWKRTWWLPAILLFLPPLAVRGQERSATAIDDVSGKYHFLSADDTLGLLEEEGKLKGYIEILQGEEESDAVLSYDIVEGTRKGDRVEFKTNIIHRKYYRFSGRVERGAGHGPTDPDYLHLYGMIEIVSVKPDKTEGSVERKFMVLKSIGTSESEGD